MPDTGFATLFIIAPVASLAPLAVGAVPSLRVPAAVVEGIAVVVWGPVALGLQRDAAVRSAPPARAPDQRVRT